MKIKKICSREVTTVLLTANYRFKKDKNACRYFKITNNNKFSDNQHFQIISV